MPTLPQPFTASLPDIGGVGGRRASPEDFAGGDPGLLQAGHAVAKASEKLLSNLEESESRKAIVAASAVRAKYARLLDEAALNNGDLDKLREQMANELAAVGADFQTTRGASTLAQNQSNTQLMFDEQANRIGVQRAQAEVKLQGTQLLRDEGTLVMQDPSRLKAGEEAVDAFVSTFKGRLSPQALAEQADLLKKGLNMTAALAVARDNPKDAIKRVESGDWNLTPDQRLTVVARSEAAIRAREVDEAREERLREKAKAEADETARDGYVKQIMSNQLGQKVSRAILDDPNLTSRSREHLLVLMKAQTRALAGEEKAGSKAEQLRLFMAIHAPEGTPGKVYDRTAVFESLQAGRIDINQANFLFNQVAAQKDEDGRSFGMRLRERAAVLGRALNDSPEYKAFPERAAALQMELIAEAERQSARMRKEGKSPDVLLDPDSKDFFFKPGILRATEQAIRNREIEGRIAAMPGTSVVRDGYVWRHKGGDPAKRENWERGEPVSAAGKIK